MVYNVDFCVISLAFLMITVIFYLRMEKMPSRRNRLFAALLLCGVVSLVFDMIAALENPCAYALPRALIYIVNIIFLGSVQLSGLFFLFYTMTLTQEYAVTPLRRKQALCLPFVLIVLLLLATPFIGHYGIFYLDEGNGYLLGAMHQLLYVVMAFYLILSITGLYKHRKMLRSVELFCVASFVLFTLCSMCIQLLYPWLLVNSMANALSISLIYYVLEAPDSNIDPMTGYFNRAALPLLLQELKERHIRFTLFVFPLRGFRFINHTLGMKTGDEVLVDLSEYLKKRFPKAYYIRLAGTVFGVLVPDGKPATEENLRILYDSLLREYRIDKLQVQVDIALAGYNSESIPEPSKQLTLLESVLKMHFEERIGDVLLIDEGFEENVNKHKNLELALSRALDNGGLQVWYQPIHNCEKRLVALEALVRLYDPDYGALPTQEAVEMAEQNGSIARLGEQVLHEVCDFIVDNDVASWGIDHIGVNISAVQCMQPDLADKILHVCRQYKIPSSLLAFEITETAAGSVEMLRRQMERLCAEGYFFLLDDFGKGYANFSHISLLPFHCVKIDKALLWEAMEDPEKKLLLKGLTELLNGLSLYSVCEGVETEEQLALLKSYKVSMLQGYYFSKPLPPEELLAYRKRQEERV